MPKGLLPKQIVVFSHVLDKVVFTHVVIIGLPTVFYYCALSGGWNLSILQALIPALYLVTSLVVLIEATVMALCYCHNPKRRWERGLVQRCLQSIFASAYGSFVAVLGWIKLAPTKPSQTIPTFATSEIKSIQPRRPLPRCSIIVVAYLPNEQHIILETLQYLLLNVEHPQADLEIILAYNRAEELPVEQALQRLALRHPELHLLFVKGSKTKAENLNAALQIVTGEVTCILDADHLPQPNCFQQAWFWLEDGSYDVVQGRNVIRNHNINCLTRIIAVEFECLYGVSHSARSLLVDTAMFCGSNGYWRTSVLRRIHFSAKMMTEDIDATLRTLLMGYRIVHDPTIVTTELAPLDLQSFWFQRKRWAQGWIEVTVKYQWPLLRSGRLDPWQKLYWTLLLLYSSAFHLIALQIFPMIFSLMLRDGSLAMLNHTYLPFATVLTFLSSPYQALIAMGMTRNAIRYPLINFLLYIVATPVYCTFKNIIAVIATYDYLLGEKEWIVTRRDRSSSPAPIAYVKQVNR
ncbi:MAG: glycosyltransferase [Aphanocapsa sp. GSE-SYN-MK-11-07L]|jgi:cellulose synthase/poly-beta-1,6-N-acetylglucosamine synthase-like glycosyltransferase|nr:glycosyltransferase [Aphanocapsa sp. GSE-SYN-MK-11-07L]